MSLAAYLRIWLASIRYSVARTMMFRFDFCLWVVVDTLWMAVGLLTVEVVFGHIDHLAGWTKPQMQLLVGTGMLIMRLFMGLFMTNLFAVDRSVREGTMDFTLAQPGNPLFMLATRKIELDGITNSILAVAIIVWAAHGAGLHPGVADVAIYALLIFFGLVIHFSTVAMVVSLAFWIVRVQGIEQSYFGIFDLSRLPRQALRGVMEVLFVYLVPAVIVSNFPALALIDGFNALHVLWLGAAAAGWFALGVWVFNRGLRRYASASS